MIIYNIKEKKIFSSGYLDTTLKEKLNEFYSSDVLDYLYFNIHSKYKILSKSIEDLVNSENYTLLVSLINNKFTFKWTQLLNSLNNSNYNPIENYSMEEIRTPNLVNETTANTTNNNTITDNNTMSNKSTNSNTNTLTSNYNDTINNDVENKTSAFDNNAYQPNTKTTNNTTSNQETTSNSNQESSNSQTQTINNTQNQELSKNESMTTTNKGTETLTRKGNIGVTTTQQMVEQEVELRKHNLIDIMFNDIDSLLTIDLY